MEVINAIDQAILVPATQLGGDSAIRDQIVYAVATILPYVFVLIALWAYFSGQTKAQQEKNREVVFIAAAAVLIATATRALLAGLFARPRPYELLDIHNAFTIHPLLIGSADYSFPSGHAFVLFAAAGVVFFIGHPRYLGIVMLVIATIVVAARVIAGVHYPSDVIGGAILGLLLAKLLSWQSRWVGEQLR